MIPYKLDEENIHVGPSDYVPWLKDRKWCYIRMEGTTFGDVPLNMEVKVEVWDLPNSAGVVIDAVRCVKLAKDRGTGGPILGPSSYFMKTPPQQYKDDLALANTELFIQSNYSVDSTLRKRSILKGCSPLQFNYRGIQIKLCHLNLLPKLAIKRKLGLFLWNVSCIYCYVYQLWRR